MTTVARAGLWTVQLSILMLIVGLSDPAMAQRRPAELKDFFSMGYIDGKMTALSPDGQGVAYTQYRPLGVGREPSSPYEYSMRLVPHRYDVWVLATAGGAPTNITHGEVDGASFWGPEWSPDGQRLIMLSTRGGGSKVRIWVWSRLSGQLRQLSSREIDPGAGSVNPGPECMWLSKSQVFFVTSLEPVFPLPPGFGNSAASSADSSALSGASTASVIKYGNPRQSGAVDSAFIVVDVDTGEERVIETTKGRPYQAQWNLAAVSPSHEWLAYLEETGRQPLRADEGFDAELENDEKRTFRAHLVNLKRPATSKIFSGSEDITMAFEQFTFSWSPDSTQLIVASYGKSTAGHHPYQTLRRCGVESSSCTRIEPGELVGPYYNLVWYKGHELLARGKLVDSAANELQNAQQQELWWRVDGSNLNPLPDQSADSLLALDDDSGFLGVVNGSIWKLDFDGRPTANLMPTISHKVTSIFPPSRFNSNELAGSYLSSRFGATNVESTVFFQTDDDPQTNLFELDARARKVLPIQRPIPTARLAGFAEKQGVLLFRDVYSGPGRSIWLTRLDGSLLEHIEKNSVIDEILPFKSRYLQYTTLDGKDVWAHVLLPPQYKPGDRYPTIVIVYPGDEVSPPDKTKIDRNGMVPLRFDPTSDAWDQILAAHGYAVMTVSMPGYLFAVQASRKGREESHSEPYEALTYGVLPAIDAVVDAGIADPDHLGVLGHSFGGYASYGLITQTTRFKAAVSMSGFCDLVSLYGAGRPDWRYGSRFAGELYGAPWDEVVMRMDMPPWKNMSKYLRNSPIAFADRVATPLMIVQGDMDFIPMQQGEEFFAALQRQNKRVEFVRYWGENHVISSPDNVYDMWRRIYAWFDEFLRPNDRRSYPPQGSDDQAH